MGNGPYDFWEEANNNTFEAGFLQDPRFYVPWIGVELGNEYFNNPRTILNSLPGQWSGYGPAERSAGSRQKLYRAAKAQAGKNTLPGRRAGLNRILRSRSRTMEFLGVPRTGNYIQQEVALGKASRAFGGASFAGRSSLYRNISFLSRGMLGLGVLQGMFMVGGAIGQAVGAYEPQGGQYTRRELETANNFVDTRSAQTQRSRAIQAIHNSHLSTRAVFGNEASHLHYS